MHISRHRRIRGSIFGQKTDRPGGIRDLALEALRQLDRERNVFGGFFVIEILVDVPKGMAEAAELMQQRGRPLADQRGP